MSSHGGDRMFKKVFESLIKRKNQDIKKLVIKEKSYSQSHKVFIRKILFAEESVKLKELADLTSFCLDGMLEETKNRSILWKDWKKKYFETWDLLEEFPHREDFQEIEIQKVSDAFWKAFEYGEKRFNFSREDLVWISLYKKKTWELKK